MNTERTNKLPKAFATCVCLVATALACLTSRAATTVVSNLAGLTNAIAKGCNEIVLKPGVYDLTTLETHVVSNGSSFAWGTNCSVDKFGPAHIVFQIATTFSGESDKPWSEKSPEEETIIRGGGESDTMRLIYGYTGGGRGSTWRNITFEGGNAGKYNGGAIFITEAHLTADLSISNCVFRNNRANIGGAMTYMSARDCLFENNVASKGGATELKQSTTQRESLPWTNYVAHCVFRGNKATGTGGGAICGNANFGAIYDCTFSNNSATATGGDNGLGGAVKLDGDCPDLVFRNCTFENAPAAHKGGAVFGWGDVGGFSNCTFACNAAKYGGAVASEGTVASIDDCTIVSNTASVSGGALYLNGLARIANATVVGNTARSTYGGLYVSNFALGGTATNCLFEANTNSASVNVGSQLYGMTDVVGCTFRGYGDMIAVNYDRCLFERCSFDYDNWGGGMVQFTPQSGPGHVRNCLFANNTAHVYIRNTTGQNVEISNCTFANNLAKTAPNQGNPGVNNDGYILYAHRSPANVPSTNVVSNCIFANNSWRGGLRMDIPAYVTRTNVAKPAQNLLVNCLYESGALSDCTLVSPVVGAPKFVAGDSRYPDAPEFMIRRSSPARKAGVVLDWMADGTDFAGAPRVGEEGTVDLGAYQCTLPQIGFRALVK